MFDLETPIFLLLLFCLFAACAFEFVNGFHDTANAVATVIYTNSLKPTQAVVWAGFMNFLGCVLGGVGVAMGIVNLLPTDLLIDTSLSHSIAMILSLLFTAIIWNLGTWYFGIPASSSHTLIGAIIGVGLGHSYLKGDLSGVNWDKAKEMFTSLLLSPMFGFAMAIILMFLLRRILEKKTRKIVFDEPEKGKVPPIGVRITLWITCTLVSFFHGQNDGQKGIGLVMLILIAILPAHFALDNSLEATKVKAPIEAISGIVSKTDTNLLGTKEKEQYHKLLGGIKKLNGFVDEKLVAGQFANTDRIQVRKNLITVTKSAEKLIASENVSMSEADKNTIKKQSGELKKYTDFAPFWVILMIALSIGLGTMIGWKRIVVTIGEKIGKNHLTYAQGASAELVAASTIGLASYFKLPVSTTHVLSSGIAGTMVAQKGVKNLQPTTVKTILLAWVLTLPFTIIVAASLFVLFRTFAG